MAIEKKPAEKVMTPRKISFLYVTAPSKSVAEKIAKTLMKEKLIACANIFAHMKSIYFWKGQLTQSQEVVVILKMPKSYVARVRTRVAELHPYEVPCVAEIPIASLNASYAQWLLKSVSVTR